MVAGSIIGACVVYDTCVMYTGCGERTGVVGGGGAVVAHGSSGLVALTSSCVHATPISLPHLFNYGS